MVTGGKRRTAIWFGIGVLVATFPLALLAIPGVHPRDMLARHWGSQLAAATDEELPVRLRQIAGLQAAGLPLLADALSSERESLSRAAYDQLNQLLDRWQLESSGKSSHRVARLAHLLADQANLGGPMTRRRRSELATRLLLWPVDGQAIDASELVMDCETVLRAHLGDPENGSLDTDRVAPNRTDSPATLAETSDELPAAQVVLPTEPPADAVSVRVTDTTEYSIFNAASRPSMPALPAEIPEVPELPRPDTPPPPVTVPVADVEIGFAQPPQVVTEPPVTLSPVTPQAAEPAPNEPRPLPDASSKDGPVANLPDRVVMDNLMSQDPEISSAAVRELQQRGFQPAHLVLARRLVDTDPEVRLALVDTVTQVPALDARPWLVWLTRDEDPMVRKAAVAVIATSNDPGLRQHLVDLERDETDPEVLRLVRSVLDPRRL